MTLKQLYLPALFCFALTAAACTTQSTTDDGNDGPNAERGFAYVQSNCSSCHAVSAGDVPELETGAPGFVDLANIPGMNRIALSALLRKSHKSMPNFIVPSEDVDDIAAYLATLQTDI